MSTLSKTSIFEKKVHVWHMIFYFSDPFFAHIQAKRSKKRLFWQNVHLARGNETFSSFFTFSWIFEKKQFFGLYQAENVKKVDFFYRFFLKPPAKSAQKWDYFGQISEKSWYQRFLVKSMIQTWDPNSVTFLIISSS